MTGLSGSMGARTMKLPLGVKPYVMHLEGVVRQVALTFNDAP